MKLQSYSRVGLRGLSTTWSRANRKPEAVSFRFEFLHPVVLSCLWLSWAKVSRAMRVCLLSPPQVDPS